MADSDDTDALYLGFLAPALIALIAGLLIHSFIIGVNVTDWWKGRSVTPVDRVVTSLGVSRMGTQCTKAIFLVVIVSRQDLYGKFIISTVYIFFTYANFWLTSLLSIVFCLKISNFHSRLFLYLRGMIAHRTAYFIIAAVLLSVFNCVMPLSIDLPNLYRDKIYNTITANVSMHCTSINYIYTYTAGAIFPFLSYSISSVVLFTSLYHHTTKMKLSSNLSINLETYYSLMKFVSFTFIYNTGYFIGHLICVFYYYFYCSRITWLRIVLDILPVLHSSYLIYRIPRLRSQMSKVLQYLSDFVSPRKVT